MARDGRFTDRIDTTESPEYNRGKWGNEDSIPENESPCVARLIVRSRSGVEYRSATVKIPVMTITKQEKIRECVGFPNVERYSLLLFDFNRSDISPFGDRIFREYIYSAIPNRARIRVMGYTDGLELAKSSLRLSEEWARAVVQRIREYVVLDSVVSLEGQGVGREAPLYSGGSPPEGRCFNRTVQVTMEYPREEWGGRW